MRKLLVLVFIFAFPGIPQQKYMIFFADKESIENPASYNTAVSDLTGRSIERRKKVMGSGFITPEDLPVKQDYINIVKQHGVRIENVLKWFNAVSSYLTPDQISEIGKLSFIRNIVKVRSFLVHNPSAGKNFYKEAAFDSFYYGESYTQLRLSDIPRVHNAGITGSGVLLGILDTGFKWKTHESLSHADVISEYDFIFKDSVTENQPGDVIGQQNHGTTVFSVIAGLKDSLLKGGAYNASFLLAKTEDIRSETRIEEDNYAAALEWMENHGVDITTSSLGYDVFDDFAYTYNDMNGKTTIVTRAAELAFARGVLVISAAGNEGNKPWYYISAPADGFNVIAAGAVDEFNRIADFSSRGPTSDGRIKPDVVAMGISVFGATATGSDTYGFASGTSLAAPITASCAVLLLSANPYLSNVQMRDIITRTAGNYKYPDNERGYGLILAGDAIEYPNIKADNGEYIINKIFLDNTVVSVKIYVSADGKKFNEYIPARDSARFTFSIPHVYGNQVIKFYYEYTGSKGNQLRVPETGFYQYTYGTQIIKTGTGTAADYFVSNNFPNPFNNTTRINFNVPASGNAELVIYDALGQRVKTLFNSAVDPGEYSLLWNGEADDGKSCASGIYIYRINVNGKEQSHKMILMK